MAHALEPSSVQDFIRDITSNDIGNATFDEVSSLSQATFSPDLVGLICEALVKRLVDNADSWRRVLKTLMIVEYLLHSGSESLIANIRARADVILPFTDYKEVEERGRDRAPAVREKSQKVYQLLIDDGRLDIARSAAALVLNLVDTGKLDHERSYIPPEDNARTGDLRVARPDHIQQQAHYRSWVGVRDISPHLKNMSLRPITSGGFADIYHAEWDNEGRTVKVAVKLVRTPSMKTDPKFYQRHMREIALWHEVQHANVLPLHGLFWGSSPFPGMVSSWCEHGDINKYIASNAEDPRIDTIKLELLEQVLQGLLYLHESSPSIVHADIKGGNVLVSDKGVPRLCDFGLASVLSEHSKSFTLHSVTNGTVRWMAPELFVEDTARHTTSSDIWALGCLILEVQSGHCPWHDVEQDGAVILRLYGGQLPSRPAHVVPTRIWGLVLECLYQDPAERPPVSRVLNALHAIQADQLPHSVSELPSGTGDFSVSRAMAEVRAWLLRVARGGSRDMDDVMLAAIFVLLTTPDGLNVLESQPVKDATLVTCSALNVCISRARLGPDALACPVAHAAVDRLRKWSYDEDLTPSDRLERVDSWHGVSRNEILVHRRPSYDLRPLAKLLASVDQEIAEWLMLQFSSRSLTVGAVSPSSHESVSRVAFGPNNHTILSKHPGEIAVVNTASSSSPSLLREKMKVDCLAISSEADRPLVVAAFMTTVRFWDPATSSKREALVSFQSTVSTLVFSPDGAYVAIGFEDGDLSILRSQTRECVAGPLAAEHPGPLLAVVFSPDGESVLTASYVTQDPQAAREFVVRSWSISGNLQATTVMHDSLGTELPAFSSDGSYIVAGIEGEGSHHWKVWDSSTGRVVRESPQRDPETQGVFSTRIPPKTSLIRVDFLSKALKFSIGGNRVVGKFSYRQGSWYEVWVWDITTGNLVFEPLVITDAAYDSSIACSWDCSRVAVGKKDGSLDVRDITDWWSRWE